MAHFELVEQAAPNAVIKVVGVGGGGGNAVAHMVNSGVEGVEFITANTDAQAIKQCGAKTQLQLGANVTKGLGAGANPEVGRQAALEDRDTIIKALEGADMVFIAAGMGGGTGTGGAGTYTIAPPQNIASSTIGGVGTQRNNFTAYTS